MSEQLQCFISFLDTPFSDEQITAFNSLSPYDANMIQRISVVDGRVLVRGISTPDVIDSVMAFLTNADKDPHLLFAHYKDGELYTGEPGFTEYLSFFPSYTVEGIDGDTITIQPPQNTGSGWKLPDMSGV